MRAGVRVREISYFLLSFFGSISLIYTTSSGTIQVNGGHVSQEAIPGQAASQGVAGTWCPDRE